MGNHSTSTMLEQFGTILNGASKNSVIGHLDVLADDFAFVDMGFKTAIIDGTVANLAFTFYAF